MTRPWPPPSAWPLLAPDDVHVWLADLGPHAGSADRLLALLAPDERRRAEAFRMARDRDRFVAARAILRRLLARHLGVRPGDVALGAGVHGKPELMDGASGIRFNAAHSGDVALFAVARGREVGVDVERVMPAFDWDGVARACFSDAERGALNALAPAERQAAFFRVWTRKEAYAKGRGHGLRLPLAQATVPLDDGGGEVVCGGGAPGGRWAVHPVEAGPDHAAALALPVGHYRVSCWRWREGPPAVGSPPPSRGQATKFSAGEVTNAAASRGSPAAPPAGAGGPHATADRR
jgi:4'-phosphopantetheinyl transferase